MSWFGGIVLSTSDPSVALLLTACICEVSILMTVSWAFPTRHAQNWSLDSISQTCFFSESQWCYHWASFPSHHTGSHSWFFSITSLFHSIPNSCQFYLKYLLTISTSLHVLYNFDYSKSLLLCLLSFILATYWVSRCYQALCYLISIKQK